MLLIRSTTSGIANHCTVVGLLRNKCSCRAPEKSLRLKFVFLGFSLGAFHDGAGPAEKCKGNYLMAATVSGSEEEHKFLNSLKLSPCSIEQIQSFFAYVFICKKKIKKSSFDRQKR